VRGTAGARRRAVRTAAARREYDERVAAFKVASPRLGRGDLSNYYWYHTIDLGGGIVTPGDYDYRDLVPLFQFPADMRGLKVLDVGSATGFFAFEFERRGATVVSVELPSIADWDMPPGPDREKTLQGLMQAHGVTTVDELTRVHLHAPFELCRSVLGSKVARCYSRIYDLSPATLGHDAFDMIFAGDILLHTFSPLAALAALAPLCRGLLVITQVLAAIDSGAPLMLFTGNARDRRTWWHPNRACLEQMLRRIGFREVTQVALHDPPGKGGEWLLSNEAVIHARK
jgi:tRNA (mo5U34)-methyltransferase